MSPLLSHALPKLLIGACIALIAVGGWSLSDYSHRATSSGNVAANLNLVNLPRLDEKEPNSKATPKFLLFYHPHCPCTLATVRNWSRNCHSTSDPQLLAFAYCPGSESSSWIDSPTTELLRKVPGVQVYLDRQGETCRNLGVRTSGHVLLYAANGQLLFSGGITPSRGHEGDCLALSSLLRKLAGEDQFESHWPVFGCPIVSTEEVRLP